MLLTLVTALGLAATPAVPQTWYGATAGAGPGGETTSAVPVTGLGLSGTPALPVLEEAWTGGTVSKSGSDSLSIAVTDASSGSTARTFTWSGTSEGFAERGDSAAIAFAYTGAKGNPSGGLQAVLSQYVGGLAETEECTASIAWTDLGVPASVTVTYVEAESIDARTESAGLLGSQDVRVRIRHGGTGATFAPMQQAIGAAAGGWNTRVGDGPKAVDAAASDSTSGIDVVVGYDVTRLTTEGSATVLFDNLILRSTWTAFTGTTTAGEAVTELKLNAQPGGPIWDFSGRELKTEVDKTSADSLLLVAALESPVDEQEVISTDDLTVGFTEGYALASTIVTADSLLVAVASIFEIQGSGGTVTPVPAADTTFVRITEGTSLVYVAIVATDTASVTISEAAVVVAQEQVEKTGTDTLVPDLIEEWQTLQYAGQLDLVDQDILAVRVAETAFASDTSSRVRKIRFDPRRTTIQFRTPDET